MSDDDLLPAPVLKKKQKIILPNGAVTGVDLQEVPCPAPIFHDTPEEAQIDDELTQITVAIRNMNKMWKAVRTVSEAISLSKNLADLLQARRRLANRQLGAKHEADRKATFYIPD